MALKKHVVLAVIVLGMALIFVYALRPPTSDLSEYRRETMARERERWATDRRASAYVTQYRMAVLKDSIGPLLTRPTADPVRVIYAPNAPANLRVVLDSIIGVATREIGGARMGIDVVVASDSARSVLTAMRSTEGVRAFDILPATEDQRCVRVITFGRVVDFSLRALRTDPGVQQVLGQCRYYAAFGMPGTAIRQWMREKGSLFAASGSWTVAPPVIPTDDPELRKRVYTVYHPALYYVTDEGLSCMNTGGAICDSIMLRTPSSSSVLRTGEAVWLRRSIGQTSVYGVDFGGREDEIVASMVRTLGRERFAQFWNSNEPVPAAFEKASGIPLRSWIASYLVDQYGALRHGPRAKFLSLFNGLLIIGAAVGTSVWLARRRQFA